MHTGTIQYTFKVFRAKPKQGPASICIKQKEHGAVSKNSLIGQNFLGGGA